MQTGHSVVEGRFDGTYNSDGGSQFLGNHFRMNGAPIYFGANPWYVPVIKDLCRTVTDA